VNDAPSSDDQRSAKPLRHAQTWICREPLALESGGQLPDVTVCFETWGALDADRANAIVICHALSGDSHVARHDAEDDPGWWELLVGPGKAIDTDRYFVICSNVLGGCRGTTGPNFPSPETGRPYGADFPIVTVHDMVEVQKRLLDHLGIERLLAVVGGSLGGLQVLDWATAHPERVGAALVVAAAPRLSSQGIAFDVVGRNAIRHDPRWKGGQYYDGEAPEAGLAIARMLAHITYLSDESMRARFDPTRLQPRQIETGFESVFSVGSYLAHQGDRFVERFDANSYITLSTAMDLFDLGESQDELRRALAPAQCRWLFLSFSTDWLYPPEASRRLVDALIADGRLVSLCEIESSAGHDSFLLEDGMRRGAPIIASFLAGSTGRSAPIRVPEEPRSDEPTSIFFAQRLDYEVILRLVPERASIVDLGCGNGELLSILRDRGHAPLLGIERDEAEVALGIARGLDVVHADLDEGLAAIPDRGFDVALLSQTLQSIVDVAGVLDEIVRIADRGIVSFPNFAHAPMREMFMREGRLPKEEGLYAYDWHDTPNRRFPSILDFEELCAKRGIRIEEAVYVDSRSGETVTDDPNLNADIAVVAISR
jgi:homoserine O-acetyltransferase